MHDGLPEGLDSIDPEAFGAAARPQTEDVGWSAQQALSLVGITYRQVDYWARTKLVEPSIQQAAGSGTRRLYSFRDVLALKIVKRLLDTGISLQNIRVALTALGDHRPEELSRITLFSDGVSVYEVTTAEEVVDLLHGSQCVFGLSLRDLVTSAEADVIDLPGTPLDEASTATRGGCDELAQRRTLRAVV